MLWKRSGDRRALPVKLGRLLESVADPPVNAAVPNAVAPSLNVILPVAAGSLTLAVNVTFVPTGAGFVSAVTVVVVAVSPGGGAATIPRHPVLMEIKIKETKAAIRVRRAGCFREKLRAMSKLRGD